MLNFINTIFRGIFQFFIVIALIGVAIGGFIGLASNPLIGFLILVGGFFLVILTCGLVSMFINIDANLQ
jgi:hypothetical protein